MKLDFLEAEDVGHLLSTVIQHTFDIAIKEYGIAGIDGTVRLTIGHPSIQDVSIKKTANGFGILTTAGTTKNRIYPGNIVTVKLMAMGSPKQVLKTWSHELTHVAQLLKGRLRQEKSDPNNKGLVWDGKFYGMKEIKTLDKQGMLPWELDADAEAERILPKVINDLKSYINTPTGRAAVIQEAKEIFGCTDGSPGAA